MSMDKEGKMEGDRCVDMEIVDRETRRHVHKQARVSMYTCLLVYFTLSTSYNTGLHPQSAIIGGIAKRENGEHKFHSLPSERTQIQIHGEVLPIIFFAECPEIPHDAIGKLIIHAQEHATGGG